jgi:hypothetical protein
MAALKPEYQTIADRLNLKTNGTTETCTCPSGHTDMTATLINDSGGHRVIFRCTECGPLILGRAIYVMPAHMTGDTGGAVLKLVPKPITKTRPSRVAPPAAKPTPAEELEAHIVATPETSKPTAGDLRTEVQAIFSTPDAAMNAFAKVEAATDKVLSKWLVPYGKLMCGPTPDSGSPACYWLDKETGKLYDMAAEQFRLLMELRTNYARKNSAFAKILANLFMYARRQEPSDIHKMCYYDQKTRLLLIADGTGKLLACERDGEWHQVDNGYRGFLVIMSSPIDPIVPDYSAKGAKLNEYLGQLNFLDTEFITGEELRIMWLVNILLLFFDDYQGARMLLLLLGTNGSTKSSTIRWLVRMLYHMKWEVTRLRADKQDSLDPVMAKRPILALDNVDNHVSWIMDLLAAWSTGASAVLRVLHTTNDMQEIEHATKMVVITSRSFRANRPDLMERAIVFNCGRPGSGYWTESANITVDENDVEIPGIKVQIEKMRPQFWGDLLTLLGKVAAVLPDNRTRIGNFRQADFRAFGRCVALILGKTEDWWFAACKHLTHEQLAVASIDNILMHVIQKVMERNNRGDIKEMNATALFKLCETEFLTSFPDMAARKRWKFPESAAAFGTELSNHTLVIEQNLKVKITKTHTMRGNVWSIVATVGAEEQGAGTPAEPPPVKHEDDDDAENY